MNVLGHPYVAWKVLGTLDKWVVAGSWLPDLVPFKDQLAATELCSVRVFFFVPDSVFTFEEIHEGGERFLEYLDQHAPDKRGLALGMLIHSVKFGTDKFSRDIEERFESVRGELAQRVAESAVVSLEVARKHRFHNYLWWGIDVQILRYEKEFMQRLLEVVPEIGVNEISKLLSECFDKNEPDVRRMLNWIFGPLTPENLASVQGLAEIWKGIAAGLPERDQIDVEKTVEVFEFCTDLLEDSWGDILEEVTKEVGKNVEKFQ